MSANRGRIPHHAIPAYLEARALLDLIGPDPNAEQHMRDLATALGLTCRAQCDQPARARGLCDTHYRAHQRAHLEAHTINRKAAA